MGFRRKRSGGGGGGGGGKSGQWMGFMAIIMGIVALIINLIMFNVGIGALDDAYTAAATYTEQIGLLDIMGIWGMVIFLIFVAAGIAALTGGSVMQWRKAVAGSWMDVFMVAIMGGVTLVIALILNGIAQTTLHTAYLAANATVNKAHFTGLLDIMGIWGMVIFVSLMAAGIAQIAAAAYGSYKHLAGKM
ncbi:MAG: hypothetical protein A2Y58_03235 [Chloroflexi bacterium RBG_13_51_52]|nr:MAG: hypothetical protein A2Y58_03235 [Chloroflexi bacterium RBG_13_51_52]